MGWEKLADIGATIVSWFTPEKAKERRRNKIDKLKAEQEKLLNLPCTTERSNRLVVIRMQLKILENEAKND